MLLRVIFNLLYNLASQGFQKCGSVSIYFCPHNPFQLLLYLGLQLLLQPPFLECILYVQINSNVNVFYRKDVKVYLHFVLFRDF